MKAAIVKQKGAPLVIEERPTPEPGEGTVRIKVHACGICHSDQFVVDGIWPSLKLPRVPGHEVAGVVDAVGPGVTHIQPGARVGVGWYGGHCGVCRACREGDFVLCENGMITGISFDGGYEEYMLAPASALAAIPEGLDFSEAAPLLCAGITTFNALRNSGARAGDVVAVHGLGGLGHLGVQFARAMGFYVVAIARGAEKADLAKKLGAHEYLDSLQGDATKGLQKLGGANVILSTAVSGQAASDLINGLGRNGCLVVLGGSPDPISIRPGLLIGGRRRIQGWPSGQASDSEDTLRFSQLHGIRPRIETFPLGEAQGAYQHMMQGKARFRAVLKVA
jgi:D-arabinose 1-dehydrogenase-like Zn-dependent alcohol dehydrogenase